METIDDIYYAFGQNFLFASVLFLPDSLLRCVEGDVKESLRDMTNAIFIVERDGENYLLDGERNSCGIHILYKKALLDDNILILIRYRENNQKKSFEFVLQKYMEQLGGYTYFSKWLFENARTHIKNISNDAMNALELQYSTFLDHSDDMREQFPIADAINMSRHPNAEGENSAVQLGDMLGNNTLDMLLQVAPKNREDRSTAKDRKSNIRADIASSADRLILENIFNVRPKNE